LTTEENLGVEYQNHIRDILSKKELLPKDLKGNDAGFFSNGIDYYIEIKNRTAPDFGQKILHWDQKDGWYWAKEDIVTELYDKYGVLDNINPNFIPRRHSVPKDDITPQDKIYNQKQFKRSGIIISDLSILYEFYARKDCYYIQIEGLGFYYMKKDIANLDVLQFTPNLTLRLRAKTVHSYPIYNYRFYVVININKKKLKKSNYDLEGKVGPFPNITP